MMKTGKKLISSFVLLSSLVFAACTPSIRLDTRSAQESEMSGTYTGIFYGCNFFGDLESVVLLDREGDKYTFEPYAPDFKFRIKKGLTPAEALAESRKFLDCGPAYSSGELNKIVAPNGEVLGYEIRPTYHVFVYGTDVLDTYYRIRDDNKVIITIRVLPFVNRLYEDGSLRDRMR